MKFKRITKLEANLINFDREKLESFFEALKVIDNSPYVNGRKETKEDFENIERVVSYVSSNPMYLHVEEKDSRLKNTTSGYNYLF